MRWRARWVALGLMCLPLAAQASSAPALVIAYHTTPAHWLSFRQALRTGLRTRLRALKRDGALRGFQVFFARNVDSTGWNTLAVLDFNGTAGLARWNALTRSAPAGLSQAGLALTSAIVSTPVERVRTARSGRDPAHPVYLILPYHVTVGDEAYLRYLDGYTFPQLRGWMKAGILSSYAMLMDKYPAGRPWSALLVLEYAGDGALSRRDAVKSQVRAALAHDRAWKSISEHKFNIRAELAATVAERID